MKRLRRFNESKSHIDYDYVYQCFAELLDDNKAYSIHINIFAGEEKKEEYPF
jgi:hypothetical protein